MTARRDRPLHRAGKLLREGNADLDKARRLERRARKIGAEADRLTERAEARFAELRTIFAVVPERPTLH